METKIKRIDKYELSSRILTILTIILAAPIVLAMLGYGVWSLIAFIAPDTSAFPISTGLRIGMILFSCSAILMPFGLTGCLLNEFGWVKYKKSFSLFSEKTASILIITAIVFMFAGLGITNL